MGRFARIISQLMTVAVFLSLLASASYAQTAPDTSASAPTTQPPKVLLLLDLLDDEDIQTWVKQQREQSVSQQVEVTEIPPNLLIVNRLSRIQAHVYDIVRAVPRLPEELRAAVAELERRTLGYGVGWILLLLCVFSITGSLVTWVYNRLTAGGWSSIQQLRWGTPKERIGLISLHLALRVGCVLAFGFGSIGFFLSFDWPPMLEVAMASLLLAIFASWGIWNLLQVCFAPHHSTLRILPVAEPAAIRLLRLMTIAGAWFMVGYAVIGLLRQLGMNFTVSQVVAYVLGLGLLFIGLSILALPLGEEGKDLAEPAKESGGKSIKWFRWLYGPGFCLMWMFWALSAMKLFWLLAVALALPLSVRYARMSVQELFSPLPESTIPEKPDDQEKADATEPSDLPEGASTALAFDQSSSVWITVLERAIRAILIFAAIAVLLWGWGLSLSSLSEGKDLFSRVLRSLFSGLIILLVADLLWQLVKTLIDTKLESLPELPEPGMPQDPEQAKVRTLLPIVRTAFMVLLLTLTVLMELSAVGIEIGPLLASAGIVGVAVGFGSQTLVRDVISGMFYLLDDAFRIGEYIIAGSYKGTVEAFNLRSVKLRHHRGPIYTIPFGDLGAVQNLSRDYVIDKLSFQVTYDTDLEKARKLIKKAGQELAADPEIGSKIIEPLKMQRVENFGEYGIELKTKMTCVPGGQWETRKKIYPMIKKLFEENGIEFARPTVKVAGSEKRAAGAAARTVAAKKARATKAST
jgi:small-conductance mechanosensitive channel